MPRALVLGGGVAGMSAAHELAERGYDVVVLERRHTPGGKARSIDATRSRLGADPVRTAGAAWAPGEHGFRFFPGFYKHVVDTIHRIPSGSGSVGDHLVPTSRVAITQYGERMFELPARFPRTPGDALAGLRTLLLAFSEITDLTPDDLATFGARVWQLLTTSPERRLAEYEQLGWWAFVDADRRSAAYQKFLASGITRSLVAAKARKASTRTIGDIFVQLLLTIFDPTASSTDRVLDGPTNEVWIDPWLTHLRSIGVDYRTGCTVGSLLVDGGRVTGAHYQQDGREQVAEADHVVLAMPIERAAPLVTPALAALDPTLAGLQELAQNVDWMNGIQLYLRRPYPVVHGHVIHIDTEWALTSISQGQFWHPGELRGRYADPDAVDVLSVDVSDWEMPGSTGKAAADCTREEVFEEVLLQLVRSLEGSDDPLVVDDVASWFLDPDIKPDPARPDRMGNVEPLLVNLVDTWRLRPEAVTRVPGLYLASDYVRTHTDLATMEGANEAARRAVNGILDADGSHAPRCGVWPLQEPEALEPFRRYDAERFRLGLPWDTSLTQLAATALEVTGPALGAVPALLGAVAPVEPLLAEAERVVDASPLQAALDEAETGVEPLGQEVTGVLPVFGGSPVVPGVPSAVPAGPAEFWARAGWYQEQAMAALGRAIPAGEPSPYLYDLVRSLVERPGKGLRPGLVMATAGAHGADPAKAVPSAAGLELLHGAFLVHDDVEDESLMRRGAPTLHRLVGVPLAVNAGDAMNSLSMRLFRENAALLGPEAAARIVDEVDHLLLESLEGQAMELGWIREGRTDVGIDDYLLMVLKKTSWYSFIHPMRIGAIVARPDDDQLDRFNRLGFLLGAAFQIQDDVLNLVGRPDAYGKEIGGDLWEGKRTLVTAHALDRLGPHDRRRLVTFLDRPRSQRLEREVLDVHHLLEQTGSIEWAAQQARLLAGAALDELPRAFATAQPGPDLDFVRSLAEHVVSRAR